MSVKLNLTIELPLEDVAQIQDEAVASPSTTEVVNKALLDAVKNLPYHVHSATRVQAISTVKREPRSPPAEPHATPAPASSTEMPADPLPALNQPYFLPVTIGLYPGMANLMFNTPSSTTVFRLKTMIYSSAHAQVCYLPTFFVLARWDGTPVGSLHGPGGNDHHLDGLSLQLVGMTPSGAHLQVWVPPPAPPVRQPKQKVLRTLGRKQGHTPDLMNQQVENQGDEAGVLGEIPTEEDLNRFSTDKCVAFSTEAIE